MAASAPQSGQGAAGTLSHFTLLAIGRGSNEMAPNPSVRELGFCNMCVQCAGQVSRPTPLLSSQGRHLEITVD